MTENDERVLRDIIIGGNAYDYDESILQSIFEEIKQYRAIGTVEEIKKVISFLSNDNDNSVIDDTNVLNAYRSIGTIDEFKALKEKNEPIANGEWIDTQPGYNNGYYKNVRVCSNCHDYYTTEYDEMKFCPKCGSKMTET